MGSDLSCFDWSNHASSYLDGSLTPGLQKAADQHLASCTECRERQQRYRLILDSLRSLQRIPAPAKLKYEREPAEPGRKPSSGGKGWLGFGGRLDPVIRPLARRMRALNTRSWSWIVFSCLGFAVLTSLPKLRALYEERLQKRLEAVNFAELPITPPSSAPIDGAEQDAAAVDDFGGDEAGDEGEDSPEPALEATSASTQSSRWEGEWEASKPSAVPAQTGGGAQVWRFILRTDSPQDMRGKIHQALLKAGTPSTAKMIHGFVAPGGIQFDVLVPSAAIPALRDTLKALSDEHAPPEDSAETEKPYPTEPFTWYRNRSKRPLPQGAARVIIWLSLT